MCETRTAFGFYVRHVLSLIWLHAAPNLSPTLSVNKRARTSDDSRQDQTDLISVYTDAEFISGDVGGPSASRMHIQERVSDMSTLLIPVLFAAIKTLLRATLSCKSLPEAEAVLAHLFMRRDGTAHRRSHNGFADSACVNKHLRTCTMFQWNAHGLRSKLTDLRCLVGAYHFPFLVT